MMIVAAMEIVAVLESLQGIMDTLGQKGRLATARVNSGLSVANLVSPFRYEREGKVKLQWG